MRGRDNFQNSRQYIIEQLFVLDYLDEDDFDHLKMKLWVLDGPIRNEEFIGGETPDTDVKNPMNHWETLLNDLVYLDVYIRTQEDELGEREPDFDGFWDRRIQAAEKWVTRVKDPETGETYKDWEQPYNQRPTLLTKADFSELYSSFLVKRSAGEFQKAEDIVKSVTSYSIDTEAKQAEQGIESDVPPAEMEERLQDNASENVEKNDKNYVNQLREIHQEIWGIMEWLRDSFDLPDDPPDPEDPEYDPEEEYPEYSAKEKVIVNSPEQREQVRLSPSSVENWYEVGDDNHRGIIPAGGGIKYRRRDENGEPISLPLDPTAEFSSFPEDSTGSLDTQGWTNVKWCTYVEEEGEEPPPSASLLPQKTPDDLPSGGDAPGEITQERFAVLNQRWININNLREFQISDMGTRAIIESMLNASIPALLDDKVAHFQTKKDQKVFYTDILVEQRPEFI